MDEYWPAMKIQQHAMLFRAGSLTVDDLERLGAQEIGKYREAGIVRVSKADKSVIGPVEE